MLKYTILLINSISILLFNLFFSDDVSITPKFPSTAKPGSEFMAEVVIKKGGTAGFAKLQIDLPPGFTAKEVDSKGGNFTFSNGAVKYIWTALPSDPEFTVKFMVVTDASATGAKPILGKFSYIVSNAKQQAEFGPIEVIMEDGGAAVTTNTVVPTTTTTPTVATTNTQTPESFNPPKDPNAAVSSTRTISALNEREFEVEVLIKKENIKGFAKYTDKIPAGFIATSVKTNGASFTFSDQNAKFVWVSLPATEELRISYKLEMQTKPSSKPMLTGEFSYLENDQTQKIKASDEEIVLAPEDNSNPVTTNTVTETPVTTNTVAETPVTNTVTTEPVKTIETPTVATTQTVVETPVTTNTVTSDPVITNTPPPVTNTTAKTNGSVTFNVQIGAFKSSISASALASAYNINDNIRTDMHEGFTKFLIGDFNEYKAARDKRESVKNKGVSGAFVTAYSSGKRITVQEALMIANQKWLR
ncbi:MAG: hypothetical protein K0S33_2122 [Bacteroidetes bacterium]|jgi:cell division protein FtsN|nr:hypothetical protein [Bacteroidota bacterium]